MFEKIEKLVLRYTCRDTIEISIWIVAIIIRFWGFRIYISLIYHHTTMLTMLGYVFNLVFVLYVILNQNMFSYAY